MDVIILPSLFEGLGIVALEAQANGLPSIVSEKFPNEAKKLLQLGLYLLVRTIRHGWS